MVSRHHRHRLRVPGTQHRGFLVQPESTLLLFRPVTLETAIREERPHLLLKLRQRIVGRRGPPRHGTTSPCKRGNYEKTTVHSPGEGYATKLGHREEPIKTPILSPSETPVRLLSSAFSRLPRAVRNGVPSVTSTRSAIRKRVGYSAIASRPNNSPTLIPQLGTLIAN